MIEIDRDYEIENGHRTLACIRREAQEVANDKGYHCIIWQLDPNLIAHGLSYCFTSTEFGHNDFEASRSFQKVAVIYPRNK